MDEEWLLITGATASTYTVHNFGGYAVYEITGPGCTDTSVMVSETINPGPNPQIMQNGNVLTTTVIYLTYQWNKNGVPISGATSSTYLVTSDGAYSVTITSSSGCTATTAETHITGLGVTTASGKNGVSIYPNPASSYVYIRSANKVNIAIRDLAGRLIKQQSDTKEIFLGDMAAGAYMITLTDASGNVLLNEKLIK